ncbi:transcription regulator [mine drainage metagenome]|uniref:Transcription regulator n=1 Tax=mine drainage metagenome TaxID=410659 RepID=T1ACN2_9ZZZZ
MINNKNYKILIDAFRSHTKLSIIMILTQKGKMTVTQMSKFLGTTRSNLYQAVSELTSLDIIEIAEIKSRKKLYREILPDQ